MILEYKKLGITLAFAILVASLAGAEQSYADEYSPSDAPSSKFFSATIVVDVKQSSDCPVGEYCVNVTIVNTLDRGICVEPEFLPFGRAQAGDIFEVRDKNNSIVDYAMPDSHGWIDVERGQRNTVISPKKQSTTILEIGNAYNLNPSAEYTLKYSGRAVYCDLYDHGNPDEVYGNNLDLAKAHSIELVSNRISIRPIEKDTQP